jgi:hypothetical protein
MTGCSEKPKARWKCGPLGLRSLQKKDLVRPERAGADAIDGLAIDGGKDRLAVEEGQSPVELARASALAGAGVGAAIRSPEGLECCVWWSEIEKVVSVIDVETHIANWRTSLVSLIGCRLRGQPRRAKKASIVRAYSQGRGEEQRARSAVDNAVGKSLAGVSGDEAVIRQPKQDRAAGNHVVCLGVNAEGQRAAQRRCSVRRAGKRGGELDGDAVIVGEQEYGVHNLAARRDGDRIRT